MIALAALIWPNIGWPTIHWNDALLLFVALVGHLALWIGRANALHATALPEWVVRTLSACCHSALLTIFALFAAWIWIGGSLLHGAVDHAWPLGRILAWCYIALCYAVVAGPVRIWFYHRFLERPPATFLSDHIKLIDIGARLPQLPARGLKANILLRMPLNDTLKLCVHEKQLAIPRLPSALDGLTIAHLSDFHMGDKIDRPFFVEVVREANALAADMICITGDIFEEHLGYDWTADTLAQLRAPLGVYFVLGNHDAYLRESDKIRGVLTGAGLIDLGGRWLETQIRGERVILAGNELPWHRPAADLEHAPPRSAASKNAARSESTTGPFRIILSHSPDQISWATRHDADLLLAGHTHGGQIRLPIVGPVLAPSNIDVHYSSGVFQHGPLISHISRGISGKLPLRYNCPPEITKLILRAAKS